jgi:single-strand DNA-binding protein
MSNYNKVLLMGRLTRDPELRYTPQGTPVADIGIAVNREYTVGNERRKETAFVDVTVWRRQAEVICQYLSKGKPLFVEGHLVTDSWEQDGQKRSKLKVVLDGFQFIDGPRGSEGRGDLRADEAGGQDLGDRDVDDYGSSYGSAAGSRSVGGGTAGPPGRVDDSDIPF